MTSGTIPCAMACIGMMSGNLNSEKQSISSSNSNGTRSSSLAVLLSSSSASSSRVLSLIAKYSMWAISCPCLLSCESCQRELHLQKPKWPSVRSSSVPLSMLSIYRYPICMSRHRFAHQQMLGHMMIVQHWYVGKAYMRIQNTPTEFLSFMKFRYKCSWTLRIA